MEVLVVALLLVTLLLSRGSGRAEGIPEPGLVFYGNVTDAAQVKYTSGTLSWSLAPTSGGDALLAVTELQAGDPTGYSYCLILPCETLLSGMVASTNTLRLTTPPTAYDRSHVTLNGVSLTFNSSVSPTITLTGADRGRLERIDLTSVGAGDEYAQWSLKYFNIPDADRSADPDHDGANNEAEFLSGTDPTNAGSCLTLIKATRSASGGLNVEWQAVPGKKYALYRADHLSNSPLGDFSLVTDQLIADSVRTVYEDTAATGRGPYFYLLRLLH